MATFYLDPENGNDSNNGTTFANRWKTLRNGATSARIAPGDTIRIIADYGSQSVGDATWTDNTRTVVLDTAQNVTIENCESAWTASANVTTSTNAQRFQGSLSSRVAPASAFTTGKAAYKTLGAALDLSAYEQVSLMFYGDGNVSAGTYSLKLCSDTTGDTPVHSITLPGVGSGQWRSVLWDNAGALSSSIQSVAIYVDVDTTVAIGLDNIVACKAKGSAGEITHLSLISKSTVGEPEWYPVGYIDGAVIGFGGCRSNRIDSNLIQPWRGVSESATLYARRPLDISGNSSDNLMDVMDSGSDGSPIVYSGGWDRTAMSTQSGETWISAGHVRAYGLSFNGNSWIEFNDISIAHAGSAPVNNSICGCCRVNRMSVAGCAEAYTMSSHNRAMEVNLGDVTNCQSPIYLESDTGKVDLTFRSLRNFSWDNSACAGIRWGAAYSPITIKGQEISGMEFYGIIGNDSTSQKVGAKIIGVTFKNNGAGDAHQAHGLTFVDCEFLSTTKVTVTGLQAHYAYFERYGKTAGDHRIMDQYSIAQTDTSIRHTASGYSWKLQPTNSTQITSMSPVTIPLGRFAFNAGSLVTVQAWAYRSNTGLSCGIKIPGGRIDGAGSMTSDLVAAMTAAADTWEQLTITFTPTESGVLELLGYAYGGTSYAGYFDDVTISQA